MARVAAGSYCQLVTRDDQHAVSYAAGEAIFEAGETKVTAFSWCAAARSRGM
jgi:hypothetical protein